jgi:hypothetical protein
MAGFPCPYCAHDLGTPAQDERLDRCPSCAASLQIAYRYRIVAARGKISGGLLYEAVDDIFGDKVAVVFVENMDDQAAVERFVEGNRMFAELGGGRGLAKVREVGTIHDRRPHVVIDWIAQGTLESTVRAHGPVDQTTLLELTGDLLIGLGKAHRSMPTVVHGHIHPGKIGFLDKHHVVLFGFEHAQQVYEQDSHLADAFVTQAEHASSVSPASDLHQLGVAIYYAATGEWISDKPLAQQRARVQSQLGGPLPAIIDRMLTAGGDGYRSAVDAMLDFDDALEGSSTWKARPRARQQDHSSDLAATSWTSIDGPASAEAADEHDDAHDDAHDEDPPDFSDALSEIFESEQAPPSPPQPAFPAAAHVDRRLLAAVRQPSPAPQPTASPGKVIAVTVGSIFVFGMCVAGIIADESSPPPPPPPVFRSPEAIPMPPPQPPEEVVATLPGTSLTEVHHYTGTITGPTDHAGRDVGERCDVWVTPNPGDPSLNCRWYIDCGEPRERIYGGGSVGYTTCMVEDGRPTQATDDDQDAPDGAFMALLTGGLPMVLVEDRWLLPPTRVMISLDEGGGATSEAVPNVPLAKRMERDEIETAIALNELPEFDRAEALPDKLSANQVRRILESRKDALRACEVEGEVTLKISISLLSDGRVEEVRITPEIDPDTELCLVQTLISTRFPPFSGPSMKLNWTFRP